MKTNKNPFEDGGTSGQEPMPNAAAEDEFEATLIRMDALHQVPERDSERIRESRQAFLAQASNLQGAVSNHPKSRLMEWTHILRKERSPMFTLARLVLLAALTLAGTGVTAYAAQESIPDQAMYPVKTWIEDVRLALASSPQADFDLLQGFAAERIEEIEALIAMESPVPNRVSTRLRLHLRLMLQIAAEMDDPAMLKAMEQVQVHSRAQIQILEKLQANSPEDLDALQLATGAMQNIRNSAEDAIQDPESFRLRQGTNRSEDAAESPDNGPAIEEGQGPPDATGQGAGSPGNGKGAGK